MKDDWKIQIRLYDCDFMCDEMNNEKSGPTVDLPSIPAVGDVVWPDEQTIDILNKRVRECWKKEKCGEKCRYIYGAGKSVKDISVDDFIYVRHRIFNMERKTVIIGLSDEMQE